MLNQEEGENGFELVDTPKEGNTTESSGPSPLPTWINPSNMPSNLPINLMSAPQPLILPAGQIFPTASTTATASGPQLFSPANVSPELQIPNLPIVVPISPTAENELVQSGVAALDIGALESPSTPNETKEEAVEATADASRSSGLFGWMKEALPGKKILAKVAEKARSSVDTMITTLDPQMKEFIYSGGDIDIAVASNNEIKVSAVREAFQTVFGKASVTGFQAQNSNGVAQPVGFSSALLAAQERIKFLRSSGTVHPNQPIVSIEGFALELYPDNWYEMNCLIMEDPVRNLNLQAFSQPLMIPAKAVQHLHDSTPASYPLKESGFAVTVGQAVSEECNVPATEWQFELTGISRRDILLLAAKTLANSYK